MNTLRVTLKEQKTKNENIQNGFVSNKKYKSNMLVL